MEEKIIEILQKQVYNLPDEKGHSIEVMEASDIPTSAKEISALFREFIEWVIEKSLIRAVYLDGCRLGYEIIDDSPVHPLQFNSLDQLFDYWWTNIKNK